ncbi:DUF1285 domain-containing protein [Endozoicomonas sp. SM1973]|uniref:DUF1285 domain-containing protein n=1 Tax=Spartinivicinus marinus TaxID=2994442 RepID=A0A853I7H0_9GAMM|nr:DUF1285 domain-containing protein [Spartinivicinus marinus]MCX4029231.1 DUF1285 domain-containing protein [Spartinivicinus marinus]NYZ65861.1 DUF1285 domain-containing protein [Spartinivicinus marinus]
MSQAHINPAAIAASIEQAINHPSLPPVSQWQPNHCDDIDIVIKSNGQWFFHGTPINRPQLVRLFSTVLRKEQADYYLVTPVEKLKVIVEDAPFIAVAVEITEENRHQQLVFTTNVGDKVLLGADHPLQVRFVAEQSKPYILVRDQLEALINRNVFYELVAKAVVNEIEGNCHLGLWSHGQFFSLGLAS